jgi:hypothetical protein
MDAWCALREPGIQLEAADPLLPSQNGLSLTTNLGELKGARRAYSIVWSALLERRPDTGFQGVHFTSDTSSLSHWLSAGLNPASRRTSSGDWPNRPWQKTGTPPGRRTCSARAR